MTVKEFINHYLKIGGVDYDGAYGKQCVDLFRAYHRDVVGSKKQPRGVIGAKDFWGRYETDSELKNNYIKIPNTPDFVPREGDVMIWKHGRFGHIAICTGEGNKSWFKSCDQNWYGKRQIHIIKHNYSNVFGVFRPKAFVEESIMKCKDFVKNDISAECEQALKLKSYDWYNKHWNWEQLIDFTNQQVKGASACQKELDSAKKRIKELEKANKVLKNELNVEKAENQGCQDEKERLKQENAAMETKIAKLANELADTKEELVGIKKENDRLAQELVGCYKKQKEMSKEIETLQEQLEKCREGNSICSYTVGELVRGLFSCLKK